MRGKEHNDKGEVIVEPPKLRGFGRLLWAIDAVWSYVSVVMFFVYTLNFYKNTGFLVPAVIGFTACFVYAVLNAALIFARAHDAKDPTVKKGKRTAARTFKYVSSVLKIAMIVTTVVSLLLAADSFSDVAYAAWQALSVVWIIVSLLIDVLLIVVARRMTALKERAAERVRRSKESVRRGADKLLAPVRKVRSVFSRKRADGSDADGTDAVGSDENLLPPDADKEDNADK